MGYNLEQSIQYIKGVGPQRAKIFERMGIRVVRDLLYHFPFRYEDRSQRVPISKIQLEVYHTICGEIVTMYAKRPSRGMTYVEMGLRDASGMLRCVWFNQPYIVRQLKKGDKVIVYGKASVFRNRVQMVNPDYELFDEENEGGLPSILPVYPLIQGLYQKTIRKVMFECIQQLSGEQTDFLPAYIAKQYNLLDLISSLKYIHFPESMEYAAQAKQRFIFDEFLLMQLSLAVLKRKKVVEYGICHTIAPSFYARYQSLFSFTFTEDQEKVMGEIAHDLMSKKRMNRLLQGDVGSGKTIVAGYALSICVESGYQAVLMVPTEILAKQHYASLTKQLEKLGYSFELLISGMGKKEKDNALKCIESGKAQVVIGTHALIQDTLLFNNLGLIVVDEQHRFGVLQRRALAKKGLNPDILVMTATPIPRSLALTFYGDIDVSSIKELPKGRKQIKTYYVPRKKRDDMYGFIRKALFHKKQVYVICPLVEESEKMDLHSAEQLYESLSANVFKDYVVAVVHGKMNSQKRDNIMQEFKNGAIDMLISTTVIEVGIDVPNSSIIVIEDSQRFGLSQLHQLRGRVGRGDQQSYCFLLGDLSTEESRKRVKVMVKSTDGFYIAEEDLAIRGPGEFFGTRQCGLPELKIGNVVTHYDILKTSKTCVEDLLKNKKVPKQEKQMLYNELKRRFAGKQELIEA